MFHKRFLLSVTGVFVSNAVSELRHTYRIVYFEREKGPWRKFSLGMFSQFTNL